MIVIPRSLNIGREPFVLVNISLQPRIVILSFDISVFDPLPLEGTGFPRHRHFR
jgi:hypothetical protein